MNGTTDRLPDLHQGMLEAGGVVDKTEKVGMAELGLVAVSQVAVTLEDQLATLEAVVT